MTHATNPTLKERTALCSVQRTGSASFGGSAFSAGFGWAIGGSFVSGKIIHA